MTRASRTVLVPGVLALLPEYAGLTDPVADLRAACLDAVSSLGADVEVRASSDQAARVAAHLLAATAEHRTGEVPSVLLVGNGSAARTEKAPAHLDPRAHAFDDALLLWLSGLGPAPDPALARELWADVDALLATHLPATEPEVCYDDDPFGVRYWVLRWGH